MLARDLGVNYEKVRAAHPLYKLWTFSSAKKRMSVIVRAPHGFRLYCKGASETVLGDCVAVHARDGSQRAMTETEQAAIAEAIDHMASRGLRTLALAYRDFSADEGWDEDSGAPDGEQLVFVGVVGIKDPVRPEVPDAVRRCREAGITVRMVTGDNEKTAQFIAKECGIVNEEEGEIVMKGPEFRNLPRRELDEVLKHLRVLARSSPSDKHLLVSRYVALLYVPCF